MDYEIFARAEARAANTEQTRSDLVTLRELPNSTKVLPQHVARCELFYRGPSEWKYTYESDEITAIRSMHDDESHLYLSEGPTLYTDRPERWTKTTPVQQSHMVQNTFEELLKQVPMLAPEFLSRNCRLTNIADSQKLGRAAYSFSAVRTSDAEDVHPSLWDSIRVYEGIVDRATGVLLRYAAVTDDGIATVFDVSTIDDNTLVADALLRTEVPLGTTVMLSQRPPAW